MTREEIVKMFGLSKGQYVAMKKIYSHKEKDNDIEDNFISAMFDEVHDDEEA